MLRPIPDQNSTIRTHGGDQIGILRHTPSLVDLPRMIDLLDQIELERRRIFTRTESVSPNLLARLVVVVEIWTSGIRKLNVRNLKIIVGLSGSVGSYEQTMDGVVVFRVPSLVSEDM